MFNSFEKFQITPFVYLLLFGFNTRGLAGCLVFSILVSFCLLNLIPLVMFKMVICFIKVYVFVVIFCIFLSDCLGHYCRY